MAIHTGVAEERNEDYFGPDVNRVARLLSAGHGGQILLSGAAQQLVRNHLPHDVEIRDLGHHQLKGLSLPEQIFQVVGRGAAYNMNSLHWQLPKLVQTICPLKRHCSSAAIKS